MISADVSSNVLLLRVSAIGLNTLHSVRGERNQTLFLECDDDDSNGKPSTLVGEDPLVDLKEDVAEVFFFIALLMTFRPECSEEEAAERKEYNDVSVEVSE